MKERILSKAEIQLLLRKLIEAVEKNECWTCACLQGFISRLEEDSMEDIHTLVELFRFLDEDIHHCLGCNPCLPACLYQEYIDLKAISN